MTPVDKVILTVEYKINFVRPAIGDFLECRARVINQGAKIFVAESEVFAIKEDAETLVAKALLTMAAADKEKMRKKRPDSNM